MWLCFFLVSLAQADPRLPVAELAFPRHQTVARLSWTVEPAETREAVLHVQFSSNVSASVEVVMTMPGMDHRPLRTKVQRLGPQEFEVRRLLFFMRGAWDIEFKLASLWTGSEVVKWPVDIGPGGICSPR